MKMKLRVEISHPDPKIEKKGVEAFLELVKSIEKLTGEKIEIKKLEDNPLKDVVRKPYNSKKFLAAAKKVKKQGDL